MLPHRLAVVVLMPLALAACGVPDLVAHGVKSYERSQDSNRTAEATPPPAQQPAPAYKPAPPPEPEFVPASAPERERVTAEPLR